MATTERELTKNRTSSLQVRQRLLGVLNDMLNTEELVMPTTSPDPQLSRALQHFRTSPNELLHVLDTVEEEEPTNPTDAALIILQRTFDAAIEEEVETRRDPLMFDKTALMVQGCQTFVDYVHEFCSQAEVSLKNISPFLSQDSDFKKREGSSGEEEEPKLPQTSSSLIDELSSARERVGILSRNLVHFCTYVVRLQDQSKARLELNKRLDFLLGHTEKISKEDRFAIGEGVCRELEARMEQRVMNNFVKSAKLSLGPQNAGLLNFHTEWRRMWEDRKQDLADKALRLTDLGIEKVNEALTAFVSVGTTKAPGSPSSRQRVPSASVKNQRSAEEQAKANQRSTQVVDQVLHNKFSASAPLLQLENTFNTSVDDTFTTSMDFIKGKIAEKKMLGSADREYQMATDDQFFSDNMFHARKRATTPHEYAKMKNRESGRVSAPAGIRPTSRGVGGAVDYRPQTIRDARKRPQQLIAAALVEAERDEVLKMQLQEAQAAKDMEQIHRHGVLGSRNGTKPPLPGVNSGVGGQMSSLPGSPSAWSVSQASTASPESQLAIDQRTIAISSTRSGSALLLPPSVRPKKGSARVAQPVLTGLPQRGASASTNRSNKTSARSTVATMESRLKDSGSSHDLAVGGEY